MDWIARSFNAHATARYAAFQQERRPFPTAGPCRTASYVAEAAAAPAVFPRHLGITASRCVLLVTQSLASQFFSQSHTTPQAGHLRNGGETNRCGVSSDTVRSREQQCHFHCINDDRCVKPDAIIKGHGVDDRCTVACVCRA